MYTAEDAERAAKNPGALRDDDPPLLRFTEDTVENRIESQKQGRFVHLPVVKVFVRAHGDMKSEVPFIVEGWRAETVQQPVEKTRQVIRYEDKGDERVEVRDTFTDTVMEDVQIMEKSTPWLDRLKERLHHGQITRRYFEYCVNAYEHWKANGEIPTEGYPVKEWKQINKAQSNNLINLGLRTIEDVSRMTAEAMAAYGMGAQELKNKAIAFLEASTDIEKAAEKAARLESEMETQKAQSASLAEQNSALAAKLAELEAKMDKPKKTAKKSEAA